MNTIGFIGYGSMGGMLINGFLASGVLLPEQIIVTTRTKEKLRQLSHMWPEISIEDNLMAVAQNSDTLFLCVKPLEILSVLQKIKEHIPKSCHLASIAASVEIVHLEAIFKGGITKVIPSLTSEVREGVSLICHNSKVSKKNKLNLESIFHGIGKVINIHENDFEVAADLTSCAPGMIASIFQNFIDSGLRHSKLSSESAYEMMCLTLSGTAKLLMEKNMTFSEMIARVATKGGITEEGVNVLNEKLPMVFNDVFTKTLGKHERIKKSIDQEIIKRTGEQSKTRNFH